MRDPEGGESLKSETERAVLLLADISGYTRFMTRTGRSLSHAQAIITELLKSIINEIEIPLHVVEIEGDSVYVYGAAEEGEYSWGDVISIISEKIFLFFQVFHRRLYEIIHSNMCHCEACDGTDRLRLKVIVHIGEVLFYKIADFSKLSGPDVILIHRLLKNSISSNEYLLMTEKAYTEFSQYKHFDVESRAEKYEDMGKVSIYVHYPNLEQLSLTHLEKKTPKVPWFRKLRQTMRIGMSGMGMMFGLKKIPKFNHLAKKRGSA